MGGQSSAEDGGVRISVVTVTKNAARNLAACIRSVQAQTYPHVEHVVVDGASADRTVAIARAMLRPSDKFLSEPDESLYDAMNRGVALSTGDYILFLGADDLLFDREAMADSAAALIAAGLPDMAYGGIEVRDPRGGRSIFHPPDPEQALEFMICGCLPHQATFAHRRMFTEKVGLFDLRYRVQSDYDWFLRCLNAPNVSIRRFDRVVASFALGGVSSSLERSQPETYEIQNTFPIYGEPEWVEKRLHTFQREVLALRMRVQRLESATFAGGLVRLKAIARNALRRLAEARGP